jgi:hypothetical protein
MPRTIADILAGLQASFPTPLATPTEAELLEAGRPEPGLSVWPWIDANRVRASCAHDVLEAIERGRDDRSAAERSAQATRAHAAVVAACRVRPRFTFGAPRKVEPAHPKRDMRDYMRAYMRERRARQKVESGISTG